MAFPFAANLKREMKTLLDSTAVSLIKPGWRSGYRAGLEILIGINRA